MILRYLATLAIVAVLVTVVLSRLQFATRAQVLGGTTADENLNIEFTIDADGSSTYVVGPALARFLDAYIGFRTEGPVRVTSSKVEVIPKDVTWTENRETKTSTGAALTARLKWATPSDAANGARGIIYLDFPEIPGLAGKTPDFHSGGYQKDDAGRWVVREVTTYRSTSRLSLARFLFALAAGIPFGIILHTIGWAFVLKGEKRARLAALPPQSGELPQTFYPDPIAEWTLWLLVFGIGACVAGLMAGFSISDGFMSSSFTSVIYIVLAIAVAIGIIAVYFTSRSLLTIRVESNGIAYARGRGDLQWVNAAWSDILALTQKSRTYRGNTSYWIEVEFQDNRKKLKIGQTVQGYGALRDLLAKTFRH